MTPALIDPFKFCLKYLLLLKVFIHFAHYPAGPQIAETPDPGWHTLPFAHDA